MCICFYDTDFQGALRMFFFITFTENRKKTLQNRQNMKNRTMKNTTEIQRIYKRRSTKRRSTKRRPQY